MSKMIFGVVATFYADTSLEDIAMTPTSDRTLTRLIALIGQS